MCARALRASVEVAVIRAIADRALRAANSARQGSLSEELGVPGAPGRAASEAARGVGEDRGAIAASDGAGVGSTATADMIWTGLNSETVTSTTTVVEQGHEHDELVKLNGRWVFKHRWVTSDGGMNPALLKTYQKR